MDSGTFCSRMTGKPSRYRVLASTRRISTADFAAHSCGVQSTETIWPRPAARSFKVAPICSGWLARCRQHCDSTLQVGRNTGRLLPLEEICKPCRIAHTYLHIRKYTSCACLPLPWLGVAARKAVKATLCWLKARQNDTLVKPTCDGEVA